MKNFLGPRIAAAIAVACLALGFPAAVRAQYTTVTSTTLGGTQTPANGTIYWQPVTAARIGSSGGQALGTPEQATVTSGASSITIPDALASSPNICYAVTVIDGVTGNVILGAGLTSGGQVAGGGPYGCIQPTGSTWNFDDYQPSTTPPSPLPANLFSAPTVATGSAGSSAAAGISMLSTGQYQLAFTVPGSATFSTGTVSSLSPGAPPTASVAGGPANYQLNVGLPGSPTVSVGTVTTGAPGSSATVTNSGTAYAANFNFSIPQGIPSLLGASQGAWASGTTYSVGAVASYGGNSYASLVASNVGHEPDTSPSDWGMLANLSNLPTAFASQSASSPQAGTFTTVAAAAFSQLFSGAQASTINPWASNGARTIPGLISSSTCAANDPNATANTAALNAVFSQPFTSWAVPAGIYAINPSSSDYVVDTINGSIKISGPIQAVGPGPGVAEFCNQTETVNAILVYPTSGTSYAPEIDNIYFADAGGADQTWAIDFSGPTANANGGYFTTIGDYFTGFAGFVGSTGYGNNFINLLAGYAGTYTSGNFLVDLGGDADSNYIGKIQGHCSNSEATAPTVPGLLRMRSGSGTFAAVVGDVSNCPDSVQDGAAFPVTATSASYSSGTTTITLAAVNDATAIGMAVGGLVEIEELRNTPVSSWLAPDYVQCTISSITTSQIQCTVSGEPSGVPYSTTAENAAWVSDRSVNTGGQFDVRIVDDEWDAISVPSSNKVQAVIAAGNFNLNTSGVSGAGSLWDSPIINLGGAVTVYTNSRAATPLTSSTVSNVSATGGTATITVNNTFTAGEWAYCNGLTSATWLNYQSGGPYFEIASSSSTQFTFATSTSYSSAAETSGTCSVAYPIAHDILGSAFTKVIGPFPPPSNARHIAYMQWTPDKMLHSPESMGQPIWSGEVNNVDSVAGPLSADYVRRYYDSEGHSHADYSALLGSGVWAWLPLINDGAVTYTASASLESSTLPYSAIYMSEQGATLTLDGAPSANWCGTIIPNNSLTLALHAGITYLGSTLPFTTITAPITICVDPTSSTNFIGPLAAPTVNVKYDPSLTPSAVTASTCAEQTFTVSGLVTSNTVSLPNPPSALSHVWEGSARVSAANTLAILFCGDATGGTPPSGTWSFVAQ